MSTEYYLHSQLNSNKVMTYDEDTNVVRLSVLNGDDSQKWVLELDGNIIGEKKYRIRNVGSSYYIIAKRNNNNVTVEPINEHVDDYTLWFISECPGSQDKICTDKYEDSTLEKSTADSSTPDKGTSAKPEGDKATVKITSECPFSQTRVTITCSADDTKLTGKDAEVGRTDTKNENSQEWTITIATEKKVTVTVKKKVAK